METYTDLLARVVRVGDRVAHEMRVPRVRYMLGRHWCVDGYEIRIWQTLVAIGEEPSEFYQAGTETTWTDTELTELFRVAFSEVCPDRVPPRTAERDPA